MPEQHEWGLNKFFFLGMCHNMSAILVSIQQTSSKMNDKKIAYALKTSHVIYLPVVFVRFGCFGRSIDHTSLSEVNGTA